MFARWLPCVSMALLVVAACGGDDGQPTSSSGGSGTGGDAGSGASGGTGASGGMGGTEAMGGGGMGGQPFGPDCAGLPDECGPSQRSNCCAQATVEGGTFFRGYDGVNNTDMSHPATVSTFELEIYEVTVGRFRAFVEAGMGTKASPPGPGDGAHPLIADSGWLSVWENFLSVDTAALKAALACDASTETWSDEPDPSREPLPVSCVTWFEAFAFCAWEGGRLPTEAEWNYAAAGGDEQRVYPWGPNLDETHAAYGCLADGNGDCDFTDILPVGSLSPAGDGRWGQSDLAGNVWEFVFDWWAPYVTPCDDCATTGVTDYHTNRGGGWGSPPVGVTASQRDFVVPGTRSPEIGFRCAFDP